MGDKWLQKKMNFRTLEEATDWRNKQKLTWHHVEDCRTLLLVARGLHKVPHTGGASLFGQSDGVNDFIDYYTDTRGRVHPCITPIGRDPGDDLVCLGVAGEMFGKVYFWNKIGLPGDNVEYDLSSTHLVANSFFEFIDAIKQVPIE